MMWAILCWHPQGAYWLKGKAREGDRAKVLTFTSEQQALDTVRNIEYYSTGIGGLEVLEYSR